MQTTHFPIRMTNWNKYRFFYFVAKESNFSKAARILNISQSGLSRTVAALEDRLKVKLFKRLGRGISLTEEGKSLLESLNIVFHELSCFEEKVMNLRDDPQGLLKVFVSHPLSDTLLNSFITDFIKSHPQIQLSSICHDRLEDPGSKRADAFLGLFDESSQHLEQRFLTTYQVGLYAHPDYLQNFSDINSTNDLKDHRFIVYGDPHSKLSVQDDWMLKLIFLNTKTSQDEKLIRAHLYYNCTSSVIQAALDGLGIITLPNQAAKQYPTLQRLLPQEKYSIDLYYSFPKYSLESKKITSFGEFLQNKFETTDENRA